MKTRSSGPADSGCDASLESDALDNDKIADSNSEPNSRSSSSTRSRAPNGSSWRHGARPSSPITNGIRTTGINESRTASSLAPFTRSQTSISKDGSTTISGAERPSSTQRHNRSIWSISLASSLVAALGMVLLFTIAKALVAGQIDAKGCRMSYMRPSYLRFSDFDTEHTRFASKYSLYLYRESGVDDPNQVCHALDYKHTNKSDPLNSQS
jgi:glycosylphosphatidylinositol deacylase